VGQQARADEMNLVGIRPPSHAGMQQNGVSCLLKFIEKHIQNSSSLARWDAAEWRVLFIEIY
jgi:hypothetical protein